MSQYSISAAIRGYWRNSAWLTVFAGLLCVLPACTVQQDSGNTRTVAAGAASQRTPDPGKIKAAVARWEQWLNQSDPDSGKVNFRCDLRKTDSLMSPYVATCGYWLFDDVEIDYTLALQDGKWVCTKGTWTAHHSRDRVVVKEINGGSESEKLEELLND